MAESEFWIKDIGLANDGQGMIEAAREDMPALTSLVKEYRKSKPLRGARIAICVIPTAATGNLVWAAKELGAEVRLCSDNVVSVDDRITAAVVRWGVPVFGKRDQTKEEFFNCIRKTTEFRDENGIITPPTQIIDDGADMTLFAHGKNLPWLDNVLLVSEQTTCGINFDIGLMKKGKLRVPVVDINTGFKAAFDNRYGPRESFISAFKACAGEIQLGGKLAVVAGYGMVGKGVVEALQMTGCRVLITEADAVRATEALMNSLEIVKMDEVLGKADLFVTATSCPHVLTVDQILRMKSGAMICNMGGNQEYDARDLIRLPGMIKEFVNPNLIRYSKGNWHVDNLCDDWLLNLRTGGNPPRVLGITFALHLMAHLKVAEGWRPEKGMIHHLPPEVEQEVAILNFPIIREKLTSLTLEQRRCMGRE